MNIGLHGVVSRRTRLFIASVLSTTNPKQSGLCLEVFRLRKNDMRTGRRLLETDGKLELTDA